MSEVKVNKISPRSGTGVTLGDSGDTFTVPSGGAITIASGATITNSGTAVNFGATGSASWTTTVKTGDFTAVAGEGYFVNTTSGEIDVTLPASPSAGDVVAVKDYANTFDTNNCILLRNGSNIAGLALNSTIATEGIAVTLVYVDATKGWLVTDSGLQSEAPGPEFIAATGGTITTVCTNFKVHTFTSPGTFCVSSKGNVAGSSTIDYLVVGGGAGGGNGPNFANMGAGGGAGGYRESSGTASGSYARSPLGACVSALPVTVTGYPVTVGAGGGAGSTGVRGSSGSNSVFTGTTTITSAGGGGGGAQAPSNATSGGSGGGSAGGIPGGGTAGTGNTPPVSPPQGNPGGVGGGSSPAGGGGGATAAGAAGTGPSGGPGGAGATSSINATPTARAGGGAGNGTPTCGTGGAGGGGNTGTAGSANTGGGGGGSHNPYTAGAGGSGVVIIRYKFQ